ncbi:hypothetical protein [Azospirillum ramasamyi]|uniref:hypothetical protein n=1 Tax=Azospirillum ramasamyi TaxID=682998 RepID=UPI00159C092E|nr:hypothetical protein [Azospirillum ramasamyi]
MDTMALTRDFKETIKARADRDPEFRKALVEEACECLLNNDFETAKTIVRDYVILPAENGGASVGYAAFGRPLG